MKEYAGGRAAPSDAAKSLPDRDPLGMAELIESCRAHTASVTELANVTSQALCKCYQYEENEPHLGYCCELVYQVLAQAQSALVSLGVVSHEAEPHTRVAEIIEGCELQGLSLTRAMHVVRATSSILGKLEPSDHDQVLLALYDIESGIGRVVDGLRAVAQGSLTLPKR